MRLNKLKLFAAISLGFGVLSISGPASADESQLHVGQPLARFALLKAGTHRYLRYKVEGDKRTLLDIWIRQLSFEEKDGRTLMRIFQRWDKANVQPGGVQLVVQDSWFEPITFRPLTHARWVTVGDKVHAAGYRFEADKVTGMQDLPDNEDKDFNTAYPEPAYNFEHDMELLQTLPLAEGYEANIEFYDAGIDPKADRYTFKVAGSNQILDWSGKPVDCWLVTADYNTGKVQSRFWFDKRSQVLIREEQQRKDGSTVVKTLLPPESHDSI